MINIFNQNEFTFDANDVVPNLLGYYTIGYHLDEIVNGINRRMDTFEPLNFLSYRQRVVEERLKIRLGTHLGHQNSNTLKILRLISSHTKTFSVHIAVARKH